MKYKYAVADYGEHTKLLLMKNIRAPVIFLFEIKPWVYVYVYYRYVDLRTANNFFHNCCFISNAWFLLKIKIFFCCLVHFISRFGEKMQNVTSGTYLIFIFAKRGNEKAVKI